MLVLLLGIFLTILSLSMVEFVGLHDNDFLRIVVVILPITISIIAAGSNRFKPGNKFLYLRVAAELLKQEIYRYRTRAGPYSDKPTTELSRDKRLAHQIESIGNQLMQRFERADIYLALRPYRYEVLPKLYGTAGDDDGMSDLTPDKYILIRIGDQLSYLQRKAVLLDSRLRILQWSIYALGGIGSFLAAMAFELWIPLTTTLVGAITTYLGYTRIESALRSGNRTSINLENRKIWWTALSSDEKVDPKNVDILVTSTEAIHSLDLLSMEQDFEAVLDKLYKKQKDLAKQVDTKQEE
jgi:hypothetical protein